MRGFYINETDTVFLFTSFSFNKGRRRVAAGRAFDNNWMIDNTTYSGNMTSACNCPNLKTQNPSNAYMVRKYKLVITFLNSNSHPFGFFSLLNVDWEDGCCCYCAISCLFPGVRGRHIQGHVINGNTGSFTSINNNNGWVTWLSMRRVHVKIDRCGWS